MLLVRSWRTEANKEQSWVLDLATFTAVARTWLQLALVDVARQHELERFASIVFEHLQFLQSTKYKRYIC